MCNSIMQYPFYNWTCPELTAKPSLNYNGRPGRGKTTLPEDGQTARNWKGFTNNNCAYTDRNKRCRLYNIN